MTMDTTEPVKVVVRKIGLVPGAKTVDLESLRKIIARTQNKQQPRRPKSELPATDSKSETGNATETVQVVPETTVTNSPLKASIKSEPVDDNDVNDSINNDSINNDSDGQSPSKRLKANEDATNNLSCCFCEYTSNDPKDYRIHIGSHLKNKVLNCNSCSFSTDKITEYNDHMKEEEKIKRREDLNVTKTPTFLHCSFCNFKTSKADAMQRHRSFTGHADDKPVQKCYLCDYENKNLRKMVDHVATHNPNELIKLCEKCDDSDEVDHSKLCLVKMFPSVYNSEETVEEINSSKSFGCTFCDYQNEELLFLLEHIKAHAKLTSNGTDYVAQEFPFGCTMCDYRCTKPNKVIQHMKSHSGGIVFRCRDCPFESKILEEFKSHRKAHTETNSTGAHICFVCSSKFLTREELLVHMANHSSEKPYSCHFCDFRCANKGTLLHHVKVHVKKKTTVVYFPCPLCPHKYSTSAGLKAHLSNHSSDKKPYQCDFCDFSCHLNETLRFHVKKHSEVNSFRCEICLLQFPTEGKLKVHVRDHLTFEKPFQCPVCDVTFSSQAQLKRHTPIHYGNADPFVCSFCPQTFPTIKSRQTHMRVSHKNEDQSQPSALDGYVEEYVVNETDSEDEFIHPGQRQFIETMCIE